MNEEVTALPETFGAARSRGDIAAAVRCFQGDPPRRDLAPYTWNLHTCQDKDAITRMPGAQPVRTGPDVWRGKKAVVIGSDTPAHDISAAPGEADADLPQDLIF